MQAWAHAAPVLRQPLPTRASAFTTFNVGDFELTAIQDAVGFFAASFFAVNAPETEVNAFVEANGVPQTNFNTTVNTLLLNTGDRLALIDTGYGDFANEDGSLAGGRLFPSLTALGVTVEDINDVIITHFHPDHFLGAAIDGAPSFPNATYYFPQAEYDFLQATETVGDPFFDFIINAAKAELAVLSDADQLAFYEGDDEIISGVSGIPAPGHSPAQSALLIQSGSEGLIHLADAATNELISIQHPEWFFGFDAIPELAVETRLALLNRAADEQLRVFAAHFAFPSVGYVDTDGDGFRFTAYA